MTYVDRAVITNLSLVILSTIKDWSFGKYVAASLLIYTLWTISAHLVEKKEV